MTHAELITELKKPFIVEYAYPTSDNARIYGMYRTGCYYVSALVDNDVTKPRKRASSHGYATREEAQAFADIMSTPVTR